MAEYLEDLSRAINLSSVQLSRITADADSQTDRQTDRQTDPKQPALDFVSDGKPH